MEKDAEYECTSCGHRWKGYRGTMEEAMREDESKGCPECGSAYWRWLNYVELTGNTP